MSYSRRQSDVRLLAAQVASTLTQRSDSLWSQYGELRDNFYHASHLYAAAVLGDLPPEADADQARQTASGILLRVLRLQQRDPARDLYGHWPMSVAEGASAAEAKPHPLPVELMGNLLLLFAMKYREHLDEELRAELHEAIGHIRASGLHLRTPSEHTHHEAKLTSLQLMLAAYTGDAELQATGTANLRLLVDRLTAYGPREYAALPWFWHWIQALSAVHETYADGDVDGEEVRQLAAQALDMLWTYRARCHLRGAWIGPHSRIQPHDAPADRNTLADYIQFGGFPLPSFTARIEGSALITYQASDEIVRLGTDLSEPLEWSATLRPAVRPDADDAVELHQYIYRTANYAVGGVWEWAVEYDNEQHRWDISFPARPDGSINQAYAFRPGQGYRDGDPRHQSGGCAPLFNRSAVLALYPAEAAADVDSAAAAPLVGVVPAGDWRRDDRLWVGDVGDAYLIVHSLQRLAIASESAAGIHFRADGDAHGILMEAVAKADAAARGISGTDDLLRDAQTRLPAFRLANDAGEAEYVAFSGDRLALAIGGGDQVQRTRNGEPIATVAGLTTPTQK